MIEVHTPCRLHFGLFAFGGEAHRQYGGVGLMIHKPDIVVRVAPADSFGATGPMADRATEFAQRFAQRAVERGLIDRFEGARVRVVRVPRAHSGLGTGTQLGMAVGRALAAMIERDDLDAPTLAGLVGRGERSAIGAHGFFHGGLIVEGGKFDLTTLSPMLTRQPFPDAWRIVTVCPANLHGLSGGRERAAFAKIPDIPDAVTDKMCRLVLLGMIPAVVERDLHMFGEALYELQVTVGRCFAAAQGGIYADPLLERIVEHVRSLGITGVGQSSWGPTIYAVTGDEDSAERLAGDIAAHFDLAPGEILITAAENHGATVDRIAVSEESVQR